MSDLKYKTAPLIEHSTIDRALHLHTTRTTFFWCVACNKLNLCTLLTIHTHPLHRTATRRAKKRAAQRVVQKPPGGLLELRLPRSPAPRTRLRFSWQTSASTSASLRSAKSSSRYRGCSVRLCRFCVRVCRCMYVCKYVCVCVCMQVCVGMYACMCMCVCLYMYMCVRVKTESSYVWTCVRVFLLVE